MKQPHYITSNRLEDILEQQYGLYHRANRSHVWDLSDLLKQQYDVNILYRIYEEGPISDTSLYAIPYIPIHKATVGNNVYDNPLLHIPEKNFDGCKSWYITDTAQWILWVQSAQDLSKAWAWLIDLTGLGHVLALNDDIRSGGWRIRPTETLRRHIREWEEICHKAHEAEKRARFERQFPRTTYQAFDTRGGYTVTQRTTLSPALKAVPAAPDVWLETQIMQQIINSYQQDQTN
jgi:hypothetical protein